MEASVLLVQTPTFRTDTLLHPLLPKCIGIVDTIGILVWKGVLGLTSYAPNISSLLEMSIRVESDKVNKQRVWGDVEGMDRKINNMRPKWGQLRHLQVKQENACKAPS